MLHEIRRWLLHRTQGLKTLGEEKMGCSNNEVSADEMGSQEARLKM